ncbi:hypothetical protein WJX73_010340 [Symbiochloris irregularis]|uniref:PPIase cyclophilin-type domain-containing protein n=1 Tax=Symbiochloris irregularis TaxID=706552 RepID=A0AAW1PK45_9CHLO
MAGQCAAGIPEGHGRALRRSIPAFNTDVLTIQKKLEDITYKLRIPQRKPWPEMAKDIAAATNVVQSRDKVMYGVPQGEEQTAQQLADDILNGLRSAQTSIEGRDADKTSKRVNKVLGQVAALELLQAPGLPYSVPKEFENLPRLTGRATVELDVQRGGGNPAFITQDGGGPQKVAHISIELDGYSAPITAGNFAAKVLQGELVNRRLASSYTSVLVEDSVEDAGKTIPLELMPAGAFDPLYRTHLDVNSGELPVLPLSIYGAVAMSHAPDSPDDDSAASQFFLYKYVRQNSGLAGLSFDEGNFAVCGYVTGGIDLVPQLQTGDVITKASLVQGKDRLIMPAGSQQQQQDKQFES